MNKWFAVLGVVAIIVMGYLKVRGIRNNNPGNLKRTGDQWQGLRPVQTDKTFYQFVSVEYGIRAMAKVLLNYQRLYGLDSIEKIIARWAPPSENDTKAYVASVAQKMGFNPEDRFSVAYYLEPLVKAIIKHENGIQPYSDETIRQGVEMALQD